MTVIVFAVEKPNMDIYENERRWSGCLANLSMIAEKNTDIQLLGESVLLILLDNNLNGLADVVSKIFGLGYKYTILNEETMWIVVPGRD